VPVNFRMTPPEIAFLVGDCQARVVITEAVLANVATSVCGIDPTLETVVVAGAGTADAVIGYDDLISEPGDVPEPTIRPRSSCTPPVPPAGPRERSSPTTTSQARR
jgi:fatty-acyl-CoA synthase